MHISPSRQFAFVLVAMTLGLACRGAVSPTPRPYEPFESLLGIVAEFQRYRDADLYRFPYPRDLSGQNVFKATAVRLGNYETLNPTRYGELVAFTRAQVYARLGEYETALRFARKAETYGGDLTARSGEVALILEDFRDAIALARQPESLADYRRMLEDRVARCEKLVAGHPENPWHVLAQCEWEQAEVDLAEFLWASRQVIDDGVKQTIDQWEGIRKRHSESKNHYRHTLRLGDCALELATEYAILFPPERGLFVWEDFARWTRRAKNAYLEVSQSFGAQERTEAAAKLAAVEALEHRERTLNY